MPFNWITALEEQGIQLSMHQQQQFDQYYQLLIEWNQKMNLTAITERDQVELKHFYDSLTAGLYFPFSTQKLVDIGAGAGFPSIPLKIAFPQLECVLVDSLQKRLNFLQEVIQTLGLEGITLIHGRAEDLGHEPHLREQFDLAVARAVARFPVLLEYSLPFVKVNGYFVALKGSDGVQEASEGKQALTLLGGQMEKIESFKLPVEDAARTIIVTKKIAKTPKKYPRSAGKPAKNPL